MEECRVSRYISRQFTNTVILIAVCHYFKMAAPINTGRLLHSTVVLPKGANLASVIFLHGSGKDKNIFNTRSCLLGSVTCWWSENIS